MKTFVLALCFALISCAAFAAESPTKDDAKALVKQAVAFAKENGKDKFFNEVRSPQGKFHFQEGTKKGLYIFVPDCY
jgi:cytochrome c